MIYAAFPVGSSYGWGVLGKYVALELAALTPTRLLLPLNQPQNVGDEIDTARIRAILATPEDNRNLASPAWKPEHPIVQIAAGAQLGCNFPNIVPPYAVGFAVFEENILSPAVVARAKSHFTHLACGSTYCADVLRTHGLTNVSLAYHGVDTTVFHPAADPTIAREIFKDKFVVYSGGKFELRKGQDIVIRAYKVLQDRHSDVALINSWFNMWPQSANTMAASKLIRYTPLDKQPQAEWINHNLAQNGIDLSRVLTIGLRDNRLLPRIYYQTDVGLFPNRVEGGTNMLLMEYMASGKPAIASFNSGHKDVVRPENARLILKDQPLPILGPSNTLMGEWRDPDLDETIEHLEWSYQNRDALNPLAAQAAIDMTSFPWSRVAKNILAAIPQ